MVVSFCFILFHFVSWSWNLEWFRLDWEDPHQTAEVEAEVVDRRVVTPVDEMEPEVLSEDMNDLRSAAEGGDVKAMFKFGKALLQGRVSNGFKLVHYPIASCSSHSSKVYSLLFSFMAFYPFRFYASACHFIRLNSILFFLSTRACRKSLIASFSGKICLVPSRT